MATRSSRSTFAAVLCCSLAACGSISGRRSPSPAFREIYEAAASAAAEPARRSRPRRPVSLEARQVPLADLLREMAAEYGVSSVAETSLNELTVDLQLHGVTEADAMSAIARSVGTQLLRLGSVYVLGEAQEGDYASVVSRVEGLDGDELADALEPFASSGLNLSAVGPLVTAAGPAPAVAVFADALDRLSEVNRPRWCVQLVVVEVTESAARRLSLDVTPASDVAMSLATGAGLTAAASLDLAAVLEAGQSEDGVTAVAEPLLICAEGRPATVSIGERLPIRSRSVAENGRVSDTGVEFEDVGLSITATVTAASPDDARLHLAFERSSQSGEADGVPVISSQSVDVTAELVPGGVYLLAGLESWRQTDARNLGRLLGRSSGRSKLRLQVWGRVQRYDAGVDESRALPTLRLGDPDPQPGHSVLLAPLPDGVEEGGRSAGPPAASPVLPELWHRLRAEASAGGGDVRPPVSDAALEDPQPGPGQGVRGEPPAEALTPAEDAGRREDPEKAAAGLAKPNITGDKAPSHSASSLFGKPGGRL